MIHRRLAAASAVLALAATASAPVAAQSYSFANLASLGGANTLASKINNAGQVVGLSTASGSSVYQAVEWNGTTPTVLAGLPGVTTNYTSGLNDAGQVVGYGTGKTAKGQTFQDAELWSAGTVTQPFASNVTAMAINDAGVIVGNSAGLAWVKNGSTVTWLTAFGAGSTAASDINAAGVIAGTASNGQNQAVVWNNGTATALAALRGTSQTSANAINDAGVVVGESYNGSVTYGVVWTDGKPVALDSLGATYTYAYDINDGGQVVGAIFTPGGVERAVLWSGGVTLDLNQFLDAQDQADGWYLASASGINDSGTIVGLELNRHSYDSRAFELTLEPAPAVPEPASASLALGGVGLMALAARRRRRTA